MDRRNLIELSNEIKVLPSKEMLITLVKPFNFYSAYSRIAGRLCWDNEAQATSPEFYGSQEVPNSNRCSAKTYSIHDIIPETQH